MAVYDWVKTLCVSGVPVLPRPFDWVSDFVNVHIVFPVCRTFQEAASGGRLCLSVLLNIWEHREWWAAQLQGKLDKLWDRACTLVSQNVVWVLAELRLYISTSIATVINWARAQFSALTTYIKTVSDQLFSFVYNTFGPWKRLLDTWVVSVKLALATVSAFTIGTVRYWVSIYNAFRTQLSAFLSDPATWILAEIERELGRTRATLLRLATLVLDMAW